MGIPLCIFSKYQIIETDKCFSNIPFKNYLERLGKESTTGGGSPMAKGIRQLSAITGASKNEIKLLRETIGGKYKITTSSPHIIEHIAKDLPRRALFGPDRPVKEVLPRGCELIEEKIEQYGEDSTNGLGEFYSKLCSIQWR